MFIYFYEDLPMWEQIISMCDALWDRGLCASTMRDVDGKITLVMEEKQWNSPKVT